MRFGRYGWSHRLLRWGLGIVFLWIGLDIIRHPSSWLGFVPPELPFGLVRETMLRFNAVFDIAIGLLLVSGRLPRITAILAVLHLLAIIVTNGIDAVVIRDVGLLGAALALLAWPQRHHRRKWFWQRHRSGGEEE